MWTLFSPFFYTWNSNISFFQKERSYNPYYTLVCQQLCRTSHAYKITLQFSLWDFLRDLGEKNVGGAAVVKNVKEGDDFGLKNISDTRSLNIAKAYAWWIAKDSVTLAVLKVRLGWICSDIEG